MKVRIFLLVLMLAFGGAGVFAWAQESENNSRDSSYGTYEDQSSQDEADAPAGDEGGVLPDENSDPGQEYVHVDAFSLGAEIGVPGFWRLRVRPGFVWVDGHMENEIFIPGFWRPERMRGKNWAWAGGHWAGRHWIAGHWRPNFRRGFVWVDGHWNRDGEWVEGFWRPQAAPERGMVWEPGYWGPSGWVEGFWRPQARVGRIWIGGEWGENGRWITGHWQPARRNEAWVHGYFDQHGHKVEGHVVKITDRNAPYAPGHYNQRGEWTEPRWGEPRREERREDRREEGREENRRGGDQRRDDRYSGNDQRESHENTPRESEQINNVEQSRRGGGQLQQIGGNNQENRQNQDRSSERNSGGDNHSNHENNTAVQGNVHRPPVEGTPGTSGNSQNNYH
jgi:hypothetical protein